MSWGRLAAWLGSRGRLWTCGLLTGLRTSRQDDAGKEEAA